MTKIMKWENDLIERWFLCRDAWTDSYYAVSNQEAFLSVGLPIEQPMDSVVVVPSGLSPKELKNILEKRDYVDIITYVDETFEDGSDFLKRFFYEYSDVRFPYRIIEDMIDEGILCWWRQERYVTKSELSDWDKYRDCKTGFVDIYLEELCEIVPVVFDDNGKSKLFKDLNLNEYYAWDEEYCSSFPSYEVSKIYDEEELKEFLTGEERIQF